jgi:hypothetical protein
VGVFVVCALAAQQQGEPADEAVEVNANCALITHNHNNYTYRPKQCKTFFRISANSQSDRYTFRRHEEPRVLLNGKGVCHPSHIVAHENEFEEIFVRVTHIGVGPLTMLPI